MIPRDRSLLGKSPNEVLDDFRKIYLPKLPEGTRRVERTKSQLLEFDLHLKSFGFKAESSEPTREYPEEPYRPDMQIAEFLKVLLEITGTKALDEYDDLWFRPGKMAWAYWHPEFDVWGVHHVDSLDLVRYVKFQGNPEQYPLVKTLHSNGLWEYFRAVPFFEGDSVTQFIQYLDPDRIPKRTLVDFM